MSPPEFFGQEICSACEGTGYKLTRQSAGDAPDECPFCEGTGDRFGRGTTQPVPTAAGEENP